MEFFQNFVYGDVVYGSNLGGIDREKLYNTGTCDKRSDFGIIVMKNDRGKAIKVNFCFVLAFSLSS